MTLIEVRTSELSTTSRLPPRFATVVLATVAVVWGVTFTVVDASTDALAPADVVAWRFGIATVALFFVRRPERPLTSALRRRCLVLGVLLGTGFLLQAWALTYTDALMSGLMTSLLVVVAPLAAFVLFRERLSRPAWCAVAVATLGVATLGLQQAGFGPGELLTFGSALCWGLHLVLLARWSEPGRALELARLQTAVVAAMALVLVVTQGVTGGGSPVPALPPDAGTWGAVLFLALVATAAAMVGLSWSQARLSATRAAVILTLEPAVAALTAGVLGADVTSRTVVGGVLLVTAMLIVEVAAARSQRVGPNECRNPPDHDEAPRAARPRHRRDPVSRLPEAS